MTPLEALAALDQAAGMAPLNRQDHVTIQTAARTLEAALQRLAALEAEPSDEP